MNHMEILGQLIGFAAMGVSFFIYQQKKRENVIILKLITEFLWIAHFAFIGGYTAMTTTGIAVFSEIVFLNNDKKIFSGKWCLYFFIAAFFASLIFTYDGIASVFPVISSSIATIGFWNKKVSKMQVFFFIQSIGMLIYNIVVFSIAGICNELITISSLIIAIIRNRFKGDKVNAAEGRR